MNRANALVDVPNIFNVPLQKPSDRCGVFCQVKQWVVKNLHELNRKKTAHGKFSDGSHAQDVKEQKYGQGKDGEADSAAVTGWRFLGAFGFNRWLWVHGESVGSVTLFDQQFCGVGVEHREG